MSARQKLSRRTFVQSTAALALTPLIRSSKAMADTPAPEKERLTMGFIGIGKQASGHLDFFSGLGTTEVLAVCDVDTTRRLHAKDVVDKEYKLLERKGYAGCDEYKDYHDLLNRKDINAVVIGTPDHWHAALVIEACKAGKDIYCEKPLTLTIDEAKTLIDAVRKYDRVFQTGSQQRSEGPFRQACDYIRNGRLGKITEVHVGIGITSKPCDLKGEELTPGQDWEMWQGQSPARPYNEILCRKGLPDTYPYNPGWRDYREYSGGFITDWGAHHFDIVQWALDMDHSGPSEAHPPESSAEPGFGAKVIYRGSRMGDEIPVIHVKKVFEHDVMEKPTKKKDKKADKKPDDKADVSSTAEVEEPAKLVHKVEENGILFIGEKGRLFVNRSMIISEPDSILKEPLGPDDKKLFVSPGHRPNWLDCIKTRKRPIADIEIGARSVTVCHLVNLAYWHGRKLVWDPKQWEFPGDAEANGWRSRERRKGYELPEI